MAGCSGTQRHGTVRFISRVAWARAEAGGLEPGGPRLGQAGPGKALCSAARFPFTCSRVRIAYQKSGVPFTVCPVFCEDLQGPHISPHTGIHDNMHTPHTCTCTEPAPGCQEQPQKPALLPPQHEHPVSPTFSEGQSGPVLRSPPGNSAITITFIFRADSFGAHEPTGKRAPRPPQITGT